MKNAVGVLGGVGPLATVYFMEMIIEMTDASKDQEHIDMLVSNHATIPDRTGFILGESSESPMDAMVEDAQMLETAGCSFVVIPCNTAHYFFEDIRNSVQIPVLNIIEETIDYAKKQGSQRKIPREIKKLGILATEGTISSGTYSVLRQTGRRGMRCAGSGISEKGQSHDLRPDQSGLSREPRGNHGGHRPYARQRLRRSYHGMYGAFGHL